MVPDINARVACKDGPCKEHHSLPRTITAQSVGEKRGNPESVGGVRRNEAKLPTSQAFRQMDDILEIGIVAGPQPLKDRLEDVG